jgi:hypothetical protein
MTMEWIKYKQMLSMLLLKGEIILKLKKSLWSVQSLLIMVLKNVNSYLTSIGFRPPSMYPCMCIKWNDGKLTIILSLLLITF